MGGLDLKSGFDRDILYGNFSEMIISDGLLIFTYLYDYYGLKNNGVIRQSVAN